MASLLEEDGGKIKPANFSQEFTEDQIKELIKCRKDPIHFIENHVMIQHPKLGAVKFRLFEFQKNLIRVYLGESRVIAMLSRQCGKTTTAAAFLLWWAIFKRDQTILIASKDQGGADEIMERLWFAYEELPWFLKPGVKKNDVRTKHFDNGSKVRSTATTKTSGRGKSNSLIYLDEFAFVRPSVATEFWAAIYPTLATGGNCIITSTPNTDEDKFATIWFNALMSDLSDKWEDRMAARHTVTEEEEKYDTIYETEDVKMDYGLKSSQVKIEEDDEEEVRFMGFHAHWTSVPEKLDRDGTVISYRGEKFRKETIAAGFTQEEWMREFECCFISGDSTLISGQKLATLRYDVKPPRFIDRWGCRWYEEILPNMAYAVALDPSEGVDLDDACIQVWEIPTLRQVAEWNTNKADQTEQVKMLRRILARIYIAQNECPEHNGENNIYYSVERNGLGIGIIQTILTEGEEKFPGWMIDSSETSANVKGEGMGQPKYNRWRGLLTSTSTKKRYCIEFKNLVERNLFTIRSEFLASQLKMFVKAGQSYRAKEGAKDDIVMSCVIMMMLVDELRYQEPELDDIIRPDLLEDMYDPNDPNDPQNMAMLPQM